MNIIVVVVIVVLLQKFCFKYFVEANLLIAAKYC